MIDLPKYVKDIHISSYTYTHTYIRASQVAPVVKNPPANAGDTRRRFDPWVGKITLEEGMATHSSILAQRIPWTEEPGGHRVRHNWSDLARMYSYTCGPICSLIHIHDWVSFTLTEFRCPLQPIIQWSFTKSNYTTCSMSVVTGRGQVKKTSFCCQEVSMDNVNS